MNDVKPVRWMVNFWHPEGDRTGECDFPKVSFWNDDRACARKEAARVLIELREKHNDTRDWVAAGHPDPFEVGAGRHPGGQWILRYKDLKLEAAGGWQGVVDEEDMKHLLYEARNGCWDAQTS